MTFLNNNNNKRNKIMMKIFSKFKNLITQFLSLCHQMMVRVKLSRIRSKRNFRKCILGKKLKNNNDK